LKVLVINCGSSSAKFQLIGTKDGRIFAKGNVERIGFEDAIFTYVVNGGKTVETLPVKDHTFAIKHILDRLVDKDKGVLKDLSEIGAVGHRFVNGGSTFIDSVVLNEKVHKDIEKILDIAPLHNPAHLLGIDACLAAIPETPQVIVFDTAFHAKIKPEAYMYALPYKYYEKYSIRRYGFHGTSHFYVSHRAAEIVGKPVESLKIITCHLGNGASVDAVRDGFAVDTSMGFTPLEGLIMGTRTGDIDPAAVLYIMKKEGISPEDMDTILNKKSGVLGITGISPDMREIHSAALKGNKLAKLAIDMYAYRIKKYISAYTGILGGLDILVFTAGVGENDELIRSKSCDGLSFLGIELDEDANNSPERGEREIGKKGSPVRVFVIPTNEEIVIAREAERLARK
jgi:acetate kinase